MWLREFGINSSYLYAYVSSRIRRNIITTLHVGNTWVKKVDEVHEEVVRFLTNHFLESYLNRKSLDKVDFKNITLDDHIAICSPFTLFEIHFTLFEIDNMVVQSNGNKIPSPPYSIHSLIFHTNP